MAEGLPHLSWRTLRAPVTSVETPLTSYKYSEFVTAQAAGKVVAVHPASAILIRFFGTDAANEAADVIISGWMSPDVPYRGGAKDTGPGHRLWRGLVTLGAKSIATFVPIPDGPNWASGTWLEADTISAAAVGDYDMVGDVVLDAVTATDGIADQESCLILPTLGYTHLLTEVVLGTAASLGAIYRPISRGNTELQYTPTV